MKPSSQHAIASNIGSARLSTYLSAASNDQARALELYLWNLEAAAAVTSTTSLVEVYLRNTMNLALGNWNTKQNYLLEPNRTSPYSSEWLIDPAPKLKNSIVEPPKRKCLRDVSKSSMKNINNDISKSNPTHDDYVAGLTFGTWTSLLPNPNANASNIRVDIWNSELGAHFSKPRNSIFYWSQHLRYARNRASHLEPLLDTGELMHFHRCAARLLNALDPASASWFAGQEFIPKVIRKKP